MVEKRSSEVDGLGAHAEAFPEETAQHASACAKLGIGVRGKDHVGTETS